MVQYDTTYYVNKEKRTVVCKINDCMYNLCDEVEGKGMPPHEYLLLKDSYIGKAVCSVDDTFDEEFGKKLAFNRAVVKLNADKVKVIDDFINGQKETFEFIASFFGEISSKYIKATGRRKDNIDRLLHN